MPFTLVEDLALSGLAPTDMGVFEVPFGGAYQIPYYLPNGELHPIMYRRRLYAPKPGEGKYSQPSHDEIAKANLPSTDATYPYLNPFLIGQATWEGIAAVRGKKLLIVEGEKKSACAMRWTQRPAIGIGGCEQALVPTDNGRVLHPVIAAMLHPGDEVELVFDGDIHTNPNVARAAGTTGFLLERMGVRVTYVKLPEAQKKVGLDDYLVAFPEAERAARYDLLPRFTGREVGGLPIHPQTAWRELRLYGNKAGPINTLANVEKIVMGHWRYANRFRYNELNQTVYIKDGAAWRPFNDGDAINEVAWLQDKLGFHAVKKETVFDALTTFTRELPGVPYHPVLDNFKTLKWDGTPRLASMFINYFGADDTLVTRLIGEKWLLSAVARVKDPGCKVDTMLILEGEQGIGKSQALEILAGPGGYVASHSPMHDKDFLLNAHMGWLVDVVELGAMKYADMNVVKGLITTREDVYRSPYARVSCTRQRSFVMVGSTNTDNYLKDDTGGRRFWPIACGRINIDGLIQDRDQLLAEAINRYETGEQWWEDTTKGQTSILKDAQAARQMTDPLVDILAAVLNGTSTNPAARTIIHNGNPAYFYATSELMVEIGMDLMSPKSGKFADLMRHFPEWIPHKHVNVTKPFTIAIYDKATGVKRPGTVTSARGYLKYLIGPAVPAGVIKLPTAKQDKF